MVFMRLSVCFRKKRGELTGVKELLEPGGVVIVQVAQDHGLDVFDGAGARSLDGGLEAVDSLFPDARGTLGHGGGPDLGGVLAAADVEEDEADVRVLDQCGDHEELAALMLDGPRAGESDVGGGEEGGGLAV